MCVVARSWAGDTVAICATGPSLAAADVAALRGKVRVVAVNDAVRLVPWADVLYSSDARWWKHYRGVPEFPGAKYAIGSAPGRAEPIAPYLEIGVLRHAGTDGLARDPDSLKSGDHSGYAAINLAVHYGVARILLLGYDLGAPAVGPSHFFGRHPAGLPETSETLYARFRSHYRTIVDVLTLIGVEVLNCTPASRLDAFPRRSLLEALEVGVCR